MKIKKYSLEIGVFPNVLNINLWSREYFRELYGNVVLYRKKYVFWGSFYRSEIIYSTTICESADQDFLKARSILKMKLDQVLGFLESGKKIYYIGLGEETKNNIVKLVGRVFHYHKSWFSSKVDEIPDLQLEDICLPADLSPTKENMLKKLQDYRDVLESTKKK